MEYKEIEKITVEDLRKAYYSPSGCVNSRVSFDGAFKDEKNEKLNAIYEIICNLFTMKTTNFRADCICSDGGIQKFRIVYTLQGYWICISPDIDFSNKEAFAKTPQDLVNYLNTAEDTLFKSLAKELKKLED